MLNDFQIKTIHGGLVSQLRYFVKRRQETTNIWQLIHLRKLLLSMA